MSDPDESSQPPGGTAGPDPSVGSSADEAIKLIGALTDWARDQAASVGGAGAGLGAALDAHLDTGAPECTWCPVCRTVHVVRATSPEVRAHLATAASSLLQAAAGLLAAATEPPPGRARSVERIDLDTGPADVPPGEPT